MKTLFTMFLLPAILFMSCAGPTLNGADQLEDYHHLFKGKRLGIIANQTAVNRRGEHIVTLLRRMEGVWVTALFGPEHGFRGAAADGQSIAHDSLDGIPIYSLYGASYKPDSAMLAGVDMLVYDIQDIGARYYTYIWSLSYIMEAAAAYHIPLVILDRPNPIRGDRVEGNVNDTSSFVGRFPIAVRHGMTTGELARMFRGEGWTPECQLTIIPMRHYHREQWFDETGLPFIAPSPNMGNLETAIVYPGMCLLEGTRLSEGRGTDIPFLIFGAPWLDSRALSRALNGAGLPGVVFKDTTFTPRHIPGKANHPKYENRLCKAVRMHVTQRDHFFPFETALRVLYETKRLHPDSLTFRRRHFDRLAGRSALRRLLQNQADWSEIKKEIDYGRTAFIEKRRNYLLY